MTVKEERQLLDKVDQDFKFVRHGAIFVSSVYLMMLVGCLFLVVSRSISIPFPINTIFFLVLIDGISHNLSVVIVAIKELRAADKFYRKMIKEFHNEKKLRGGE